MNEMILGSALFVTIVVVLGLIVMGIRTLLLPFHEVVILINGNRPITGQTGQKLLTALTSADIPIPNACAGMGTCGLCRVMITEGGGDPLPTEAARLSRAELREGKRLACQVTLREDLEVTVSEDLLAVETFACTVAATRMLSPLIREVTFDLPEGQAFDFRAGSFVQVTAPPYKLAYTEIQIDTEHQAAWDTLELNRLVAHSDNPVTRAYSIANRPADSGKLVLFIRLAVPPPAQPNAASFPPICSA
jgi:Na+-transporting NADH:ubiquinone oxidoreductase subunit F